MIVKVPHASAVIASMPEFSGNDLIASGAATGCAGPSGTPSVEA